MRNPPKMKASRTTVSMPSQMFNRAQRRVRGSFPTFSAYVQMLVREDLERCKQPAMSSPEVVS